MAFFLFQSALELGVFRGQMCVLFSQLHDNCD